MVKIYRRYPNEHVINWINTHVQYEKLPFHFECLEDGNIKLTTSQFNYPDEISLLYSLDNKTWNDWDYTTGTDVTAGQKFYIKAKTENAFSAPYNEVTFYTFLVDSKVNAAGNIMSLLYNDFIDKKDLTGKKYCFNHLFEGGMTVGTKLIDASNLVLPAITLAFDCYAFMFSSRTLLTHAPKLLPATTLSDYCYNNMFKNCSSLIDAPKLPATILTDSCYRYMFDDCLAITELHYPKSLQNNSEFTSTENPWSSMYGAPWFGAVNATVYYDL